MKMKNTWIWIAAGLGLLFMAGSASGSTESGTGLSQIKQALKDVAGVYGQMIAEWVEKIYRLETANFTSGQFLQTYSPGMIAHSMTYPYGWTTPAILWKEFPQYAPIGFVKMRDSGGFDANFLKFRDPLSGMLSLAQFLEVYQNPGRWNSTDPAKIAAYNQKLANIQSTLV